VLSEQHRVAVQSPGCVNPLATSRNKIALQPRLPYGSTAASARLCSYFVCVLADTTPGPPLPHLALSIDVSAAALLRLLRPPEARRPYPLAHFPADACLVRARLRLQHAV
jgi:hypothetical protein